MSEIWETKDGSVIFISEMSDEHLLNAHRICKEIINNYSNGIHSAWKTLFMLQGEMATYLCEKDIDTMDKEKGYWIREEEHLLEEIKKRGLEEKEIRKEKLI